MQNTEEHNQDAHGESKGLIKTPRQLLFTVILAFVVPIAIIVLLVNLASFSSSMGAGSTAQSPDAIAERIQPVAGFALVDANAPVESKTGQQVYDSTCAACHASGVAGAPKFGDNAAWEPLIKTGFDNLVKVAIEGINAMPARGGNPSLSDLEMARAVAYIANHSGASFDEPSDEAASDSANDQPQEQAAKESEKTPEKSSQPAQAQTEQSEQQADAEQAEKKEADTQTAAASTEEIDPAGEKLYNAVCFACHTTGAANAPKLGDKEAWAPYVESGFDSMMEKAISGVGAMPPRGGSQASDDELKAALQFILSKLD